MFAHLERARLPGLGAARRRLAVLASSKIGRKCASVSGPHAFGKIEDERRERKKAATDVQDDRTHEILNENGKNHPDVRISQNWANVS